MILFLHCFCAFLSPSHGPPWPRLPFIYLSFSSLAQGFLPLRFSLHGGSVSPALCKDLDLSCMIKCLILISAEKQKVKGIGGRYRKGLGSYKSLPLWCLVCSSLVPSELQTRSPLELALCVEHTNSPERTLGTSALSFDKILPSTIVFLALWGTVSEFSRLSGKWCPCHGVFGPQRKKHF